MLFVRAAFLAALVCLHVIGGAVLFRRFFPRESPWLGFFLPPLALVVLLNFIEHFVPLPALAWLLPFTTGGALWLMAQRDFSWRGLRLPAVLFTISFAFALAIKCLQPDVNFYCTEGLTDLNRILDFCLGDTVPPTDCWLPPYPHTGYYTFMHYGASVLKRLLAIDIGTAYNVASALLNALVLLAGGAAAYSLGRYRPWVAVVTLIVLAGGFTGATPIHAVLHPLDPNPVASIDIGGGSDDPVHQEFAWLLRRNPPDIAYRLYTPGCYLYYSEFHATISGHFLALLAVFAAAEVLRRRRSIFPWIYLLLAPLLAILSCTWFFFIVTLLAYPTMALAWWLGRRPADAKWVWSGAGLGAALLWPALSSFLHGGAPEPFYWTHDLDRDLWPFVIQWWPIYVPWIVLCFGWREMPLAGRWLHFLLIPILLSIELFFFTDRGTTLEKTWGGTFGVGLVILYPLVFIQRGWIFRGLSAVLILVGLLSAGAWTAGAYDGADWQGSFMHLEGDHFLQADPQMHRMEEVLSRVRGQTVLTGKLRIAFSEPPALPAFTENRSFLGWTNAEETAGHPDEAHQRGRETTAFYDGTMADPLGFLQANGISAILVWPEDNMSSEWIAKMQQQLAPAYAYFDCKGDGPNNAGLFLRKLGAVPPRVEPASSPGTSNLP